MNLLKCILTANDCYKTGKTIVPKGVMVHSTGANNTSLKRYVQPASGDENYAGLIARLGRNPNGNHWNRAGLDVCVHGFIGKLADGSVASVQTLPWTMRGWHAGTGTSGGSANNTHISFEICEDALTDADYFAAVYREAVELTAMLCKEFDLDPTAAGVVISHSEGQKLGIASNHGDVEHWFPKFGRTMDDFRADVAAEMDPEEDDDMTQEQFNTMLDAWLTQRAALAPSDWSAEQRAWVEEQGLIRGDGDGNMSYKAFCTREELAVILYRLEHPGE